MGARVRYYLLAQIRVSESGVGLERIVITPDRHPKGGPPGTVWAEIQTVETFSLEMARQTLSGGKGTSESGADAFLSPAVSFLAKNADVVEGPVYNTDAPKIWTPYGRN